MNLKFAVAKVFLPSAMKARGLQDMYVNVALAFHKALENDTKRPDIFKSVFTEAGKASARTLKRELNLKDTFEDAVDSWIIGSKAMNVKISVERKGNEAVFHHIYCPMWEHFRKKGKILCEDVCIPVAETMAKEVCPSVEVFVARRPDETHTCIKGLRKSK